MPKSVYLLLSVPDYFYNKMTVGTYVLNFVENGKWCFIYLQLFSMMFIVHLYTILFKLNYYCKLCSKTISLVFTTGFYINLLWATHASYSDLVMNLCL